MYKLCYKERNAQGKLIQHSENGLNFLQTAIRIQTLKIENRKNKEHPKYVDIQIRHDK